MQRTGADQGKGFAGWKVVRAAFVVAVFGWGFGFYGPPVFLHTIHETRGWSIDLISAAITTHFVVGAIFIANMPKIHGRLGVAGTTFAAAVATTLGFLGWALAIEPWQLFAAAPVSGFGWAASGAMAINAIVSPWFVRRRPLALGWAYNGASVGGVVFSPLWVMLILGIGFPATVATVGAAMIVAFWWLSRSLIRIRPEDLGVAPDGFDARTAGVDGGPAELREHAPLPGPALWRNRRFQTYAAGFSISLFAQIGIIAHMVSMLVPAFGEQGAGLAAGFGTLCAIAGRVIVGRILGPGADRRIAVALTLSIQIVGSLVFMNAGDSPALLLVAVALFGFGIGNVTSLPPLIAQAEFAPVDVPRAIALATASSQATFAFAPAVLALARTGEGTDPLFFVLVAAVQALAALVYLAGRRKR